jgi:uncharacterized protein
VSSSAADRIAIAVGLSARSIAQTLNHCGWQVLACDLFLDADLRNCTRDIALAPGSLTDGFDRERLPAVLMELAHRNGAKGCPLVYGSGFEDRTEILGVLAKSFRLAGNSMESVRAVKDPRIFTAALRILDIPHPEIVSIAPADPVQWLIKRAGGSGGAHVRPANGDPDVAPGVYWQRRVVGQAVSLSFVSEDGAFMPLGFSEQWADPAAGMPYRFGGAAQPARIKPNIAARLTEWARTAAECFGLRGLNGADFIIGGGKARLLEINPRPGATLDLLAENNPNPMAAHLNAFGLAADGAERAIDRASALQVLYADAPAVVPEGVAWPDWISDRPVAGVRILPGEPLCTVHAQSESREDAIAVLEKRAVDARQLFC